MTTSNLDKAILWCFGLDGPGQRCGAKTCKGTACQRLACKRNGRGCMHDFRFTSQMSGMVLRGLQRCGQRHGRFTKEKRAVAKPRAEVGWQLCAELADLEKWFVGHGHLDKKWWDRLK